MERHAGHGASVVPSQCRAQSVSCCAQSVSCPVSVGSVAGSVGSVGSVWPKTDSGSGLACALGPGLMRSRTPT
jgi:hypothetical protein